MNVCLWMHEESNQCSSHDACADARAVEAVFSAVFSWTCLFSYGANRSPSAAHSTLAHLHVSLSNRAPSPSADVLIYTPPPPWRSTLLLPCRSIFLLGYC